MVSCVDEGVVISFQTVSCIFSVRHAVLIGHHEITEEVPGSSTWDLAMGGIEIHFIIYEFYVWNHAVFLWGYGCTIVDNEYR